MISDVSTPALIVAGPVEQISRVHETTVFPTTSAPGKPMPLAVRTPGERSLVLPRQPSRISCPSYSNLFTLEPSDWKCKRA